MAPGLQSCHTTSADQICIKIPQLHYIFLASSFPETYFTVLFSYDIRNSETRLTFFFLSGNVKQVAQFAVRQAPYRVCSGLMHPRQRHAVCSLIPLVPAQRLCCVGFHNGHKTLSKLLLLPRQWVLALEKLAG